MGGSGGALGELWEAQGQLWEALGELWEGLYIQKLPINRTSGRYVNFESVFLGCLLVRRMLACSSDASITRRLGPSAPYFFNQSMDP